VVTKNADAEEKLAEASLRCKWRTRTRELFGDIIATTAMHCQHSQLEVVRAALDYDCGAAVDIAIYGKPERSQLQ
jgi:hypothetical protein